MKLGVSTTIHELKFRNLVYVTKDPQKLFLTYIDLSIDFAKRHGFKLIEVFSLFDNMHEVVPPILEQVKDRIKDFDEISFHAPMRFISLKTMKKSILVGKKLGAKKIVIHPDFPPAYPDGLESSWSFRNKPKEIVELISFCNEKGLIPCIENMPTEMPKYNKPEEFDFFVKNGGYLTLDTGHAVTVNIDPIAFLDRFGEKVRHIHLQDGFVGKPDKHYAIGNGELDYVKLFDKLQEMKFEDLIMLELISEEQVITSLNRLKKIIEF